MRGFFLVFEGPEGSGKSTQAARLVDWLKTDGYTVVQTREPGGTLIGERVRTVLLDPANYAMLPETEALLYAAARAQHVGELIRPALAAGSIVVCDRFVDSSIAYQVGGRGLPLDAVTGIQGLATGGLQPDLRVLLDLPVDVGLARRFAETHQINRLDQADLEFHERVRSCYLDLAKRDPAGWLVIDAQAPPATVHRVITASVRERLLRRQVGPAVERHGGGA